MIAWLDMESRRKRRRHRQCPGFYLVSCGHSDSTNQERSLREGLGFRNKMLNSILDIFNSSTKTHLFTLWDPLVQGDNKKTDTHLTFRIFIFVLICSSMCLARNHSNQIPSNSRITKSRKFTQGFQQPPPILSPLSHLTSHFILKNQEERRLLMFANCQRPFVIFRFPLIYPPIIGVLSHHRFFDILFYLISQNVFF